MDPHVMVVYTSTFIVLIATCVFPLLTHRRMKKMLVERSESKEA